MSKRQLALVLAVAAGLFLAADAMAAKLLWTGHTTGVSQFNIDDPNNAVYEGTYAAQDGIVGIGQFDWDHKRNRLVTGGRDAALGGGFAGSTMLYINVDEGFDQGWKQLGPVDNEARIPIMAGSNEPGPVVYGPDDKYYMVWGALGTQRAIQVNNPDTGVEEKAWITPNTDAVRPDQQIQIGTLGGGVGDSGMAFSGRSLYFGHQAGGPSNGGIWRLNIDTDEVDGWGNARTNYGGPDGPDTAYADNYRHIDVEVHPDGDVLVVGFQQGLHGASFLSQTGAVAKVAPDLASGTSPWSSDTEIGDLGNQTAGIEVDRDTGDIYIGSPGDGVVRRFDEAGNLLNTIDITGLGGLFNRRGGGLVTSTIPEPATLGLVVLGGLMMLRRRS